MAPRTRLAGFLNEVFQEALADERFEPHLVHALNERRVDPRLLALRRRAQRRPAEPNAGGDGQHSHHTRSTKDRMMAVNVGTDVLPATDAIDASPWLTVKEAAARAKCGRGVIYAAVAGHKLKAVKVGQALRVHIEWLDSG